MLRELYVRDFVLVRELTLEFAAGMTVFTGETGAGKSILIDALSLALGERADVGWIRTGAEQAEVTARFDADTAPLHTWMAEQGLESDAAVVLRRVVARDGRSKAYVNGRPVSVQTLSALAAQLIDIHGQHVHQSLLKTDAPRELLDGYAGHGALAAAVADAYRHWRAVDEDSRRLAQLIAERTARAELLHYQVQELDALRPDAAEFAALGTEHARLAHAGRLIEQGAQLLALLYEGDETSAHRLLAQAQQTLAGLCELDAALDPAHELLQAALIQVQEAAAALRRYHNALDLDPERLAEVNARLEAYRTLAYKHRVEAGQLPELLQQLQQQRESLQQADVRRVELELECVRARAALDAHAAALSLSRRAAAQDFAAQVTLAVHKLGMPQGHFDVVITALPEPGVLGVDHVGFLFSANPGHVLAPLAKVASGGELSRLALAIHALAADTQRQPTLVFDEVDSGVGGGVAEIVGARLRALSAQHQVLCVTHLPQVAAQAHRHYVVEKCFSAQETQLEVRVLDEATRVDEVARMLGGVHVTATTRAHAAEMLRTVGEHAMNPASKAPKQRRASIP